MENKIIDVRNVQKVFGNFTALEDINFEIKEREIFGLLGPSGAGKTTIINILTGQLNPSRGEATILGQDSKSLDKKAYQEIGAVLDKDGLYDRLSVEQNLNIYAKIHGLGKKVVDEMLEKVGLAEARKKSVLKLSKGMRQRLTIARSVLHKPKLLFLDEPTSGLDPLIMKSIHKLIFSLKDEGTTILLTTHNMEEATKLCDRVALLNQGIIRECGSPEELSSKYNKEKTIIITKEDGEKIHLHFDQSAGKALKDLMKEGDITSIHTNEPNLEDVFIKVTGRSLSDECKA